MSDLRVKLRYYDVRICRGRFWVCFYLTGSCSGEGSGWGGPPSSVFLRLSSGCVVRAWVSSLFSLWLDGGGVVPRRHGREGGEDALG